MKLKKMSRALDTPLSQSVGTEPTAAVKPQDDFETKGHLQTLMDAEMIKQDPEKMTKVHALAGRHKMALEGISKPKNISDLKKISQSKFAKKPDGGEL